MYHPLDAEKMSVFIRNLFDKATKSGKSFYSIVILGNEQVINEEALANTLFLAFQKFAAFSI